MMPTRKNYLEVHSVVPRTKKRSFDFVEKITPFFSSVLEIEGKLVMRFPDLISYI